jgi:hypothetical protein
MYDENQTHIPDSFVAVFVLPGKTKPHATREHIAARYELCEDMAQMLVDHASTKLFELGVAEIDVLERVYRGLLVDGSVVEPVEARWVIRRLAELLNWPALEPGDGAH